MDLLFTRYANPYLLMDEMIMYGQLKELIHLVFEEENEHMMWEFWLHRITDMSFADYKDKVSEKKSSYAMTDEQVTAQINKSKNILKNFKFN